MAGNDISSAGLDRLVHDIQRLPDALRDRVYAEGLTKAGEIIKEYVEGSIATEGLIDTGQLLESIKAQQHDTYVEVVPTGTRDRDYKTETKGKHGHRANTAVRNAEVAFINEYGTRKRPGTQFMSKAADASVDDVTAAVLDIVDDVLDQIF